MLQIIEFTVEGIGPFPFDMLRWDKCYPIEGIVVLARSFELPTADRETQRVVLRHINGGHRWRPTTLRWASCGWQVIEDSIEEWDTENIE
jgi:hypothetical protein